MSFVNTSTHPLVLSIAVSSPVFGHFDYLPIEGTVATDYIAGQRVEVPFGRRKVIGIILSVNENMTVQHRLKPISARFEDSSLFKPKDMQWLQWAARYYCHPLGDVFACALPAALRQAKIYEPTRVSKWQIVDANIKLHPQARRQREALDLLASRPEGLWQDTLINMGFSRKQLEALAKKSAIREIQIDPLHARHTNTEHRTDITLNSEQQVASEAIIQNLNQFGAFLLQGVTGSGKTEVYIEAVRQALARDRQVLILVPEINLTPQTLKRFQSRLDIPVASMHSQMGEKEKADIRDLARLGSARVIIGTRSAIFTPFEQLGLIIVDEEHDTSYKQNDGFKYSARDLGIKRAQLLNIPVVLGSATPSLETMANALAGRYAHLRLDQRAGAACLPDLSTIDVRSLATEDGLSQPLRDAITQTLQANKQVILFQNRRGYSPTLMCYDCGWLAQCRHCDVRLTVHRQPAHLHCHHCDHQQTFPLACPNCQSAQLAPVGTGTERIEYALQQHFSDTPVYRMDRDTITSQSKLHQFLEAVNRGEPCIIVGTQMIAKGHDFRHIALVGIIDADGLFFSADFRAMERGSQLLLQVAGRAGRGETPGRVLIQTRQPEHEVFDAIARGDYDALSEQELELRETCDLPPYSKMISVRAESSQAEVARDQLTAIATQIEQAMQSGLACQVAGPIEAAIHRRANRYRYYLHLYFDDPQEKQRATDWLAEVISSNKQHRVRLSVDVDPLETL